jgi:homoserine dehydrogenase
MSSRKHGPSNPGECGRSAPARVALLGCGTVGREVARALIEHASALGVELVSILVRDASKDRGLPAPLFTTSFERVLEAKPDAAIEVLGGLSPASAHVKTLLSRGIHVITANKTMLAAHGPSLRAAAHASGARLRYEAAVGAGIPLFAALNHLRGDRITAIRGVINGSCNFILTRMDKHGDSYKQALAAAAERGLVEPDPSADVSGRDAAEKLCVLAAELGISLALDQVRTTGIEAIEPDDVRHARRDGRAIRLVAELELAHPDVHDADTSPSPRSISARVGPTVLPRTHTLAQLEGEENAIIIDAELAGTIVLRGKGAGPRPTASAILGDLAAIVLGLPPRTEHHQEDDRRIPTGLDRLVESSPSPVTGPTQQHRLIRLRASGRTVSPAQLLGVLRTRGIEPYEAEIHGSTARVLTGPIDEDDAHASLALLAESSAVTLDSIVLPVILGAGRSAIEAA